MTATRPSVRVAVAMSGGMDSTVAAALLQDAGCEVVGLTARMWKDGSRCCSLEDIERARQVCWKLNIRHVVVNAYDLFARCVVDRFAAEYIRGRTPSPCVTCNEVVKFGLLLQRAREFDCAFLATGHYARIEQRGRLFHLLQARDRARDQSYFLHRLSQFQLSRARFPLGDLLKKADVIPYAVRRGLPLPAGRRESQDICFAPKGEHARLVERIFPGAARPGPIVDAAGAPIGTHAGLHRYTIGQRRGLGAARRRPEPLYVTRLDTAGNRVTAGPYDEARAGSCTVEDVRWIAGRPPAPGRAVSVRIRYRHEAAPARWTPLPDGRLAVVFDEPQFAVTPGQAAVFYAGDEVLGGGWIAPTPSPT